MSWRSRSEKQIEESEREELMGDGRAANRAKSIINHGEFVVINDARGPFPLAADINTVNARQMDTPYSRGVADHPRLRLFSRPYSPLLRSITSSWRYDVPRDP